MISEFFIKFIQATLCLKSKSDDKYAKNIPSHVQQRDRQAMTFRKSFTTITQAACHGFYIVKEQI